MKLLATCVSVLPLFVLTRAASAQDWPHLRGPGLDGRAVSSAFDAQAFDLRVAWKTALGSAYSGIAAADGHVVTLASGESNDFLIACKAEDGSEAWRTALGPHYMGHDGSADGPISSPMIGDGRVFAISARGKLIAASLEDGQELWSKDLVKDFGAKEPEYGFTTTPLLEGEVLIVQVGGSEQRGICAFEPESGQLVWSAIECEAGYQSPVAMDLAGKRQVVVLGGKAIHGIAPANGEVLWSHAFEGERDSAGMGMALPLGNDRFGAPVGGRFTAFETALDGDRLVTSELYRSRELGRTYASPVVHDGHIYGFTSSFLTCVDASNGKRVWKSRPPGGAGLMLVDNRLVVFGAQGVIAVAKASAEGYVEEARTEAFEHSGFTWPSFADGKVFVRNTEELACVDITPRATPAAPVASSATSSEKPAAMGASEAFSTFVAAVEAAEDKQAAIDAFLAEQKSFPIVADGHVHFVFQDEVEDIAIAGSMIDGSKPDPLERIAGTNFYYKTYPMEAGARHEYRFQVDFAEWRPDPLNDRTVPALRGDAPTSEVLTPEYTVGTHFEEPEGEHRGRLETFEFESESPASKREVSVYLPAGYDASEAAYPLLIVHRGADWLAKGQMQNSLDNLIGESVRPLIVAFVTPISEWWYEAGGTGTEEYIGMLAREFVPHLSERYRIATDPADRALMGSEAFGLTALYATLLEPDAFGAAAANSASLDDRATHAFFDLLEEQPNKDARYFVAWNRYDIRNVDREQDCRRDSKRLLETLTAKGCAVSGGEMLDGGAWGSWRALTDDMLVALFPME